MNKKYDPNNLLFSLHIPKSGGTSFRKALIHWFTIHNKQFIDIENRPNVQLKARWFFERGIPQSVLGDNLYLHYKNQTKKNIPNLVYKESWLNFFSTEPKCIHGHFSEAMDGKNLFQFYPSASQFIAFIRDPLELHLSMFHYHTKLSKSGGWNVKGEKRKMKVLDVDEWLEHHDTYMLKFFPFSFSSANYKKIILDNFIHIGITEEIDISLSILADKLNKPHVGIPVLNKASRFQHPSESAIKLFKEKHRLEFEIYDFVKSYNLK